MFITISCWPIASLNNITTITITWPTCGPTVFTLELIPLLVCSELKLVVPGTWEAPLELLLTLRKRDVSVIPLILYCSSNNGSCIPSLPGETSIVGLVYRVLETDFLTGLEPTVDAVQ